MEILAFDRGFDRNAFSCGEPDLDNWLKTGAGQQERANNTRTFLAVDGSKVNTTLRRPIVSALTKLRRCTALANGRIRFLRCC